MQTIRKIFLFSTLLLLFACSPVNLRVAEELADNGLSASLDISDSYNRRASDLELYLEGEYILAGLKKGYSAPGKKSIEKVDSVKEEMLARKELFANFAKVYEAFAELVLFEDSDNIENPLRSLTSALNDYSKLTKGRIYFSKADEDILAISGKKIFESIHKYKVKKASELIRLRLSAAKELLEKQSEKSAVIKMEQEIDRNRLKVAIELWKNNLGLPTEIIREHIQTYGLQVNEKETIRQIDRATTDKMKDAIENVMKFRHERKLRSRKDAYNASVSVLQNLINAHLQFEKGERLSLENIKRLIVAVNQYTNLLKNKKDEKD